MKTPKSIISIDDMKKMRKIWADQNKKVSFVPTMGALHQGHLSLIEHAKKNSEIVVVSIFVNPAQFGPNEDFEKYPRTLNEDLSAMAPLGVDAVFLPNVSEFYPDGFQTYVDNHEMSLGLCGGARPGHFKGVCTVVLKLFNIVQPNVAVFGLKDYQQFKVISKMVEDLLLDIEVLGAPIERDEDGLALSSRNKYLDEHHRELAGMIPVALNAAYDVWDEGVRSRSALEKAFLSKLSSCPEFKLDYVKVCNQSDLKSENDEITEPVIMLVAVFLDGVRLIDNIEFEWKET